MSSEKLSSRVGRIIAGGFNAIMDAVEDRTPELVMEQAIREVDAVIDEVQAELGREIANKHLITRKLMDENRRHEELSGQVEIAVKESREDLAKAAVARQLDIEAQIPVLESSVTDCAEREKELEGYVLALRAKRREMKEELAEYRRSRQQASSPAGTTGEGSPSRESRVGKAERAFHRVMERQTGVDSSADPALAVRLAELENLSREHRIAERLAAVKAKTGG